MSAFAKSSQPPIGPDTAILCATIVIAPQLFGGAFSWSVVTIAGLALAALAAALWTRRKSAPPIFDGVFVGMGVAWLWTCVQAVPIPAGIAQMLNLASIENVERLRGLAWAGPVPFTVSHDPGSTHVQILVGMAIVAAFLAARLGGRSGLKPLAIATVASALLLGIEGLAHRASGADAVFGIYSPRFTAPELLTPLMNGNHLGGFSLMGALIAVGLAAQRARRRQRIWAAASALCAIIVAGTLSRGAIGSLLFGFILLGAWFVGGRQPNRRSAAIPVGIVGATIACVLAFAGLKPILRRFETQGFDKLGTAARSLGLLDGSAWWLGVGRGAFSSAFVAKEGSLERYTHPENLVAQWAIEWGVPLAVGLLAVLIVALWKRLRTTDEPLVAAVCVAIFALSLQNLVDFGLEMAGVVVVVASLLGALLSMSYASPPQRSRRFVFASIAVFAVVLIGMGPRVLRSETQAIVDQLTRSMQADEEALFQSNLQRGLALHPGEPALALLAGTYAGLKRHRDAPRWLAVVMQEAPGWAAPHAVAARWLFAEGRTDQALIEIREAEQRQGRSAYSVLCEILGRFPKMEYIERAAPSEELRIDYLDRTASCPGLDAELRAEIDTAILKGEATRPASVLREAHRLVKDDRMYQAVALIQGALQQHPNNSNLWVALVRAHLSAGDPEQAQLALEEAGSDGLGSRSLLEAQARVEAALGQIDEMHAAITRLRGQSRGEATLVARSFILEGELEASLGNIDEALAAYSAADTARPESGALQQAAALAIRSGRPTYARRAYGTLCRRKPDGPACDQEARLSKEPTSAPLKRPLP